MNPYRLLPKVDKLIDEVSEHPSLANQEIPRLLITQQARQTVEGLRRAIEEKEEAPPEFKTIVADLAEELSLLAASRIRPVLNGTGVLIHTNLGRSPLAAEIADSVRTIGSQYNNLEIDLVGGARGKRGRYAEACLAALIDAPAATITNNCAAALILMLRHLANGENNEVIISRGELVEIGGGFRVPEIMEASGAKLVEVGATNKTSLEDYERAITPRTGMLLKVHRSNFTIEGFTDEPSTEELVALGKEHNIPVVEDLGSGAMVATDEVADIPHEPTATEVLKRGVDLVCVSGDKLFGGPQAGIIAGRADLVAGIKKEPFFRALRCDKMILTAMQETAITYLQGLEDESVRAGLPLLRMLATDVESDLRPRGEAILRAVDNSRLNLRECTARCGGGTMPKAEFPSLAIALGGNGAELEALAASFRHHPTQPLVGKIHDGHFLIDLCTIFPEQDESVTVILKDLL